MVTMIRDNTGRLPGDPTKRRATSTWNASD